MLRCLFLLEYLIDNNCLIVSLEFNGLRGRIVKHLRIVLGFQLILIRFNVLFGVVVRNLKLDFVKELAWIQQLTDDKDGLGADIGEEGNSR